MNSILVDVLADGGPALRDPAQPFLLADDLGAVRGDGVFETLLVRDGHMCNRVRHEQRFSRSAAALDLPAPDIELWRSAGQLAVGQLSGEAAMRWVYTRGSETTHQPTGYILVKPVTPRPREVNVLLTQRAFTVTAGAKTLSYGATMAALREARAQGCDDVIYITDADHVLEGATSTVVLVRGNQLITPAAQPDILPGTTQAALFETAPQYGWSCTAATVTVSDLWAADSVWLVSSVRTAVRVAAIGGEELPVRGDEQAVRALCEQALAT
ncbi:aminodeoxychorismate lyase [Corynebacterium sp. TAE3-ERU12]|uniref:aminodeoxychorismate lyase n=1 Tax=Corynebacterium sp. TAE3-ERU12 TaxID=2849491 RepID=UPI001C45F561|nr:aminodeoxychorismate lyase [Corynebacterium sp. TAE3-ERU12]MBV7295854.1 aminodeoxychorismate lyase [Corynebacterium sp. TAE3-ERU12]